MFGRYTFDNTKQFLPTDYPQFPREFLSRNQFFTGEYRDVLSENTIYTARLSFSRTRIGQNVEANTSQPLAPFVPGRALMGDIDIGGLKRFGPQSSGNLRLVQNVFAFADDLVHSRGAHLIKAGGLVEHYQDNMVNPTFSLGIYSFPNLSAFLRNVAKQLHRPDARRAIRSLLAIHAVRLLRPGRVSRRRRSLTLNGGLRYEFTTMPEDIYGRDSSLPDLSASQPTIGPLYENPTFTNLSPRTGFAWDVFGDGKTAVRGGYGLYFNTTNQQNLIVTVTNPPATPRPVIVNPSFPTPDFNRAGAISMRPVQFDLDNPRVHVFNVNVQRELPFQTALTIGYAGSRGVHLLRSGDVNTALPIVQSDGTVFIPAGTPRQNTSFSTIELKSSDGESWYNALIVDIRRRLTNGLSLQSSYTLSKSEDTTQASTFFSDATNGTTSAMPEYIAGYNKGPSDFDTRHNWVLSFSWEVPLRQGRRPAGPRARRQLAGIRHLDDAFGSAADGVRHRQPVAVAVEPVARPRHRPGSRELRARLRRRQRHQRHARADGSTPRRSSCSRRDVRQHRPRRLRWPRPPNTRCRIQQDRPLAALGERTMLDVRVEIFNVLNRANFGIPELRAFRRPDRRRGPARDVRPHQQYRHFVAANADSAFRVSF